MAARKRAKVRGGKGRVIAKIRKPMAPPSRVEQDVKKYRRARDLERARREEESS